MIFLLAPLFIYGYFEAGRIIVRQYVRYFKNLPDEFDGYSILHLTDFHFYRNSRSINRIDEIVRNLPSDIAVITGDFRYKSYTKWDTAIPSIRRIVQSIRTRDGIFGCLGNKETFRSIPFLESAGIKILRNSNTQIRRGNSKLYLLGVDEKNPARLFSTDCIDALKNVPQNSFKILLSHTPDYVILARYFDISLMLAGDTHGGQILLPFIGAPRVKSKLSRIYAKGWIKEKETSLYVNSGLGSVNIPIRIMCPPEIVRITLKRGEY